MAFSHWTALLACLLGAHVDADVFTYRDSDGFLHFTSIPSGNKRYRLYVQGNGGHGDAIRATPPDTARLHAYDQWIGEAASKYRIPAALVRAVIRCESAFDPHAVSAAGARGLMQLMPDTATRLRVKDVEDPRENIFGGVHLLRLLANEFSNDLTLALAAYNAGDGAVLRFGGVPPFRETREYITAVTKYYRRYATVPRLAEALDAEP